MINKSCSGKALDANPLRQSCYFLGHKLTTFVETNKYRKNARKTVTIQRQLSNAVKRQL
jgi:hypothetical protein